MDIKRLLKYVTTNTGSAKALDFWKFSYLINGINISDIANLEYGNINGDIITFFRNKTKLTSRSDLKPIRAALTPEVRLIIEKWGNPDKRPSNYIFPIVSSGMSAEAKKMKVKNFNSNISTRLKVVAKRLEIQGSVINLSARQECLWNLQVRH